MATIFISSTTEDLKEQREAVVATVRGLGHQPLVLEDLAADGHRSPLDKSRELIESCDVFIGLVAWRYGFVPERDNPDRRSFVELEHRYAWEKGIPTFVFMTSNDAQWPARFVDRGEGATAQDRFRQEVLGRVTVGLFASVDELKLAVATAVSNWQRHASPIPTHGKKVFPTNIDPFELAWRLVVDRRADASLLRHLDLDQLQEAVDKWAGENVADVEPGKWLDAAQERLRAKQLSLAPHPLWLAWIRATKTALHAEREPTDRNA